MRALDFLSRHLGSSEREQSEMLAALGCASVGKLIDEVVPADILVNRGVDRALELPRAAEEAQALAELERLAATNEPWRSFIGTGWHNCHTPAVIQRNVLENPGWYTAYTPYQAEISQGRLEALLAFQQMTIDLTGLPVANASLLDEATAAAEAMTLMRRSSAKVAEAFFLDQACHPQVIAVVRTRAKWAGIELEIGDPWSGLDPARVFGCHIQYPDTYGHIRDPRELIGRVHAAKGLVSMGVDPLALLVLAPPGELGADVAIGSAQRFGVQPGYGGPHAAFMATRTEYLRAMPGRIIGVSRDAAGQTALRMALQTREQHIRREKATSNICTAQALLANIAAFYAVWHGPDGLKRIALRTNFMTRLLVSALNVRADGFFDTVTLAADPSARKRAQEKQVNLRWLDDGRAGVSFDETTTLADVADVAEILSGVRPEIEALAARLGNEPDSIPAALRRAGPVLAHPVFNSHHTETKMMRYLKRLENRDLSLTHAMIPLGSCTMKLNAAAELAPISWPRLAGLHPFAPAEQARGYAAMIADLEHALGEIT
ncbi:MAG TPA: glycine dehydrogenase (aminomethyl-transferring), partial [Burkholderiales bacterium]